VAGRRMVGGQADDQESRKRGRSGDSTKKSQVRPDRNRGRRQKALAYFGRQEGRGQAGSATDDRSGNGWRESCVHERRYNLAVERVEMWSLNRRSMVRENRWR